MLFAAEECTGLRFIQLPPTPPLEGMFKEKLLD